jgi:parvulin-like peptidyl-prolyl isomerase
MRAVKAGLRLSFLACLAGALWVAGCSVLPVPSASTATSPAPPPTSTATPEPSVARVNGEPILEADYQAEVARFEAAQTALGIDLATLEGYPGRVLEALIDRKLLAQGAAAEGVSVTEETVLAETQSLALDLGSTDALEAWMAENNYTLEGLIQSLRDDMLAAEMVARIAETVPTEVEQVHARHILMPSREEAEVLRDEILVGGDFAEMAEAFSLDLSTRPAGGDLGWFPRGYLTTPEVEEMAFSLEPGEVGEVVESRLGFHLVQTIEREMRPLLPDALERVRENAVETWLAGRRQASTIEILIAP